MKDDFAGQRDFQSGQRFLDGSVPRLRRHAASCEAADGDLISSSAGKDQKPSWGVGRSSTVAVGGGFMVDIRCVDVHRVSCYLSKYLTKELLLSAPSRSRRVTTSRGITLLAQTPQKTVWTLVKVPISRLLEVYARDVIKSSVDEDQLLESFTAILAGTA